jgi:TolB-like protein/DNA-binding winged helix-turn-helix (wHTH) protein
MEGPNAKMLRIGEWCIHPSSSEISRNGETAHVEVRTMRLLLCLAEHAGEVISIDELLNQVWAGVAVSQDSVYQAVTSLRRLLGDDPRQPRYIETVPRLGYRMVATVSPFEDESTAPAASAPTSTASLSTFDAPAFGRKRRAGFLGLGFPGAGWAAGAAICLLIAGAFVLHGKLASGNRPAAAVVTPEPQEPIRSIAVLPFLDLTQGMQQEEFADGMTEELIDKLSKIPGLRVPSPTSSFYFKGKQIPVAEMAMTLGVAYVLDGSVRKSGSRVRVAARLVRADNGFAIWSESYDRPFDDLLMVQDDIAGEVTKAFQSSVNTGDNR